MEVIDGQHTLQARKELDLVVPYIIIKSDDPLDVARLNTGRKNWSMEAYLTIIVQETKWTTRYVEIK